MSSKITYDDKVSLSTSPLPRANKCTDDDLNEIKQVVNDNADELSENTTNIDNLQQLVEDNSTYSTTEKQVGYWVNGKPLYEKTIIATKVSGIDLTIQFANNVEDVFIVGGGLKSITSSEIVYNLDRYEPTTPELWTRTQINANSGEIVYRSTEGNYTNGTITIILRYTKTTD